MPVVRDWEGLGIGKDGTRSLILKDFAERNYMAAVRHRFVAECAQRGYEVRPSLRYKKGLQAWRGDVLVGEYKSGGDAWFEK